MTNVRMIREVNPDFCASSAAVPFSTRFGVAVGERGAVDGLELSSGPMLLLLFDVKGSGRLSGASWSSLFVTPAKPVDSTAWLSCIALNACKIADMSSLAILMDLHSIRKQVYGI